MLHNFDHMESPGFGGCCGVLVHSFLLENTWSDSYTSMMGVWIHLDKWFDLNLAFPWM